MTKLATVGKNEKMEVLYAYLSGSEFRQRVEAIVESFTEMQADLQEERRITERRWAKRDKQIQRVIASTAGMYGDLQGLIGSSLQSIPALTDETAEIGGDENEIRMPPTLLAKTGFAQSAQLRGQAVGACPPGDT